MSENTEQDKKQKSSLTDWFRRYVSVAFVGLLALYVYVLFFNDNSYSRLRELKGR